MKLISKIKRLFKVSYRLNVILDGQYVNTCLESRRAALKLAKKHPIYTLWTIYKTGPFNLPERMIDYGVVEE